MTMTMTMKKMMMRGVDGIPNRAQAGREDVTADSLTNTLKVEKPEESVAS